MYVFTWVSTCGLCTRKGLFEYSEKKVRMFGFSKKVTHLAGHAGEEKRLDVTALHLIKQHLPKRRVKGLSQVVQEGLVGGGEEEGRVPHACLDLRI